MVTRRDTLGMLAAAGLAPAVAIKDARATGGPAFLVPGYQPWKARYRGRPLPDAERFRRNLPKGHKGPVILVTRLGPDGTARRALMPIVGHKIVVGGPHNAAFFNGIRDANHCVFDPVTLELDRLVPVHHANYLGGGHAVHSPDGGVLFAGERRGHDLGTTPADQYGAIVVRDAASYQVLAVYSSHGVTPHDMTLMDGGRLLAVAHYGSTNWPKIYDGELPDAAEPSVTVIETATGKLVHKTVGSRGTREIRHLAAAGPDRILAIQTRLLGPRAAMAEIESDWVYESDSTAVAGLYWAPAPLLDISLSGDSARPVTLPDPTRARQGQSILYDPLHDQMIATFASGHALAVVDMASGATRVIRTDRLGLFYPRGLDLLPDGETYAVAGSWRGLFLFRRGTHEPVSGAARHETFFHHSHLTVAALS